MNLDLIVRWAAPIIGVLVLLCMYVPAYLRIFSTGMTEMQSAKASSAKYDRVFVWSMVISSALAITVTICIIREAPQIAPVALFIGWALSLILFFTQQMINRECYSRRGIGLLHGISVPSGVAACAIALLGISEGLHMKGSIGVSVENTTLVIAAGFWLAAIFRALPAAMYERAQTEGEEDDLKGSRVSAAFHGLSAEIALIAAMALAVGIAIATYRFGDKNMSGLLYPVGAFGASLLFGLLVVPILKPCSVHARSIGLILRCKAGMLLYLAGTGLCAYYLAVHAVMDIRAFYCFGIGLITAVVMVMTTGLGSRASGAYRTELAVMEVLMALAATILSFRWMTGYGAALCGIGFVASIPVALQIGGRPDDAPDDLSPASMRDSMRYLEPITAVGSFLILIAMLRLFAERMSISGSGIDIAEPYSLIGLAVGGIFPLMMGSLLKSSTGISSPLEASLMTAFGGRAAIRTLGILLLSMMVPLIITLFWRVKAAGGFIAGLAVAELFLFAQLRLREASGTSDEEGRFAVRVNHLVTLGSALTATLFAPSLIDATSNLTRANKILGLAIMMGALFITMFIVILRRLAAERKK